MMKVEDKRDQTFEIDIYSDQIKDLRDRIAEMSYEWF
jgi:hypothetical protein